jgi:uncharacterized RDD family membrane protein YckC
MTPSFCHGSRPKNPNFGAMRFVEISTAQNIPIDFALASTGQRMLAFAIDLIIIGAATVFLSLILGIIDPRLLALNALAFFIYTPVMEISFSGQTPGKMAMKIRVVSLDGSEPPPLDFVIRWVFRIVDIWLTLGSLAVVFISTSSRGQRLGGVLSNTMVINTGADSGLSLNYILKIEDRTQYEPKYRDVIRFTEDEMLTVKAVLDRYARYGNSAHARLIAETAKRCAKVLELGEVPEKKREFLKTLIKDYIVLTRS